MRGKLITLKFDGKCRECGSGLKAGDKAYWYGRGKVYGTSCHSMNNERKIVSFYFPGSGEYAYQNSKGRCEDAPCCGCCTC